MTYPKPDIPDEEWFPVLEAMHRELFICEREGARPPKELRERRTERVIAILTDPRLRECFWFSGAKPDDLDKLPYPKLRHLAMNARRVIQDVFLWGRNWEVVMQCSRKSSRVKTYVSKRQTKAPSKRGERIRHNPIKLGSSMERVLNKLDVFVGYGNRVAQPPANFLVLSDEVRAIVRDNKFAVCYWYRGHRIDSFDELHLVALQARETIRTYLKRREPAKPKKLPKKSTKPRRQAALKRIEVAKTEVPALWPFPSSGK